MQISRIIYVCLLCMACRALPSLGQQPVADVYASLSDEAAKAKFERAIVGLRAQQREALRAAGDELKAMLNDGQMDKQSRQTLERVVMQLAPSSDFLMSLETMLQARVELNKNLHANYDPVIARLSEHWTAYQQCKRDYQQTFGRGLAERWARLSLDSKRCQLGDYLALADERPSWLLRNSPIDIAELVPKSVLPAISQYKVEKRDLVQSAQAQLQPMLDSTLLLAKETTDDSSLSSEQREAARAIEEILTAPYAQGLRGVALCRPSEELPDKLRSSVGALLQQYLKEINRITPAHQRLLRDLHTRLESSQNNRLAAAKFAEQMAIDLHLASITHLIQPSRVLANRSLQTKFYEEAKLLELSQSGATFHYRVELLIDGTTQWVEASQLLTHPSDKRHARQRTNVPAVVPADGPGVAATRLTDFSSGQVFAYGLAGWKPAIVVDESALGVVIRWHGSADPIELYVPRNQLRIEAANP